MESKSAAGNQERASSDACLGIANDVLPIHTGESAMVSDVHQLGGDRVASLDHGREDRCFFEGFDPPAPPEPTAGDPVRLTGVNVYSADGRIGDDVSNAATAVLTGDRRWRVAAGPRKIGWPPP